MVLLPNGLRPMVFASSPQRMEVNFRTMCDHIASLGYAPFFPLREGMPTQEGLPEYHAYIREICDELWIFGIDKTTLREYQYAKKLKKPTRSFVAQFDPIWKKVWEQYDEQYGKVLEEII